MKIVEIINYSPESVKYVRPSDVGGLVLWLDFADSSCLLDKSGDFCDINNDSVDICIDKSEYNSNAKAVTGNIDPLYDPDDYRPKLKSSVTNNLNAVLFNKREENGTFLPSYFSGSFPIEDYTATSFVVWKGYPSTTPYSTIISFNSTNIGNISGVCHNFSNGSTSLKVIAEGEWSDTDGEDPVRPITEYSIIPIGSIGNQDDMGYNCSRIVWVQKSDINVYINGGNPITSTENNGFIPNVFRGKYSIGADLNVTDVNLSSKYFYGIIGEVLIYNRILDDFQTKSVSRYLALKWGLPLFNSS
jgi:hypothetical protein